MSQTKNYIPLSKELEERIREDRENHVKNPYACSDDAVIRRDMAHDKQTIWRPAFVRDCEKIMHIPYYNRYADKTQVFSLYKNDDISRRASHVQLVSRTARNIGQALNLNLDLTSIDWREIITQVGNFLQNGAGNVLITSFTVASGIFNGLVTGFLAIVFSFYLLMNKEKLGSQTKQLLYALLKEPHAD